LLIPLKATHDFLSKPEQERFNLVEASEQYYNNGPEAAQTYLNQQGMDDFIIDTELSNPDGIVVQAPGHTESSPKIEMAYRGTDKFNWSDLKADARIAVGLEDWPEGQAQIERVMAKYGAQPEHVSGYSLGANRASRLAEVYPAESSLFNPYVKPKGRGGLNLTKKQLIHRITDDPTSMPLAWSERNPFVEVRSYASKTNTRLNPIGAHSRQNFANRTEANIRDNGYIHDMQDLSHKMGEYVMMDRFEADVKAGKTFTDALDEFNAQSRVRDVLTDPETGLPILDGSRVNENSALVRAWLDHGGSFSQEELDAMNNKQVADDPIHSPAEGSDIDAFADKVNELHDNSMFGLDPSERETYIQANPTERAAIRDRASAAFDQANLQSYAPGEMPSFKSQVGAGLGSQFTVGAIGTGIAGGIAGSAAINALDPHNQIPQIPREIAEGAASGVFTGAGAAALGTAAETGAAIGFLPEAVAGGAGYLTKDLSSRLVSTGLKDLGASETATKVVTEEASDVAAGAATGATLGLALAPETLGVSVAVGALGGAIVGSLKNLWDVL
tara:strand:- start:4772 stop:6445 length:1674 start_codon:yes stop_codon:yes gene_type:complete